MPRGSKRDSTSSTSPRRVTIDPPSFTLPPDYYTNPTRYELWSIRVPIQFDLQTLDNVELSVKLDKDGKEDQVPATAATGSFSTLSTFKMNGVKYALTNGHFAENETFRLLVKDEGGDDDKDDDDFDGKRHDDSDNDNYSNNKRNGDDDETKKKRMHPAPTPFHRHVNLMMMMMPSSSQGDEGGGDGTNLAPSIERAPPPSNNDGTEQMLRRAYRPVPQANGLKRRWKPIGCVDNSSDHDDSSGKRTRDEIMEDMSGEHKRARVQQESDNVMGTSVPSPEEVITVTDETSIEKRNDDKIAKDTNEVMILESPPTPNVFVDPESPSRSEKKERKRSSKKEKKKEKKAKKEKKKEKKKPRNHE